MRRVGKSLWQFGGLLLPVAALSAAAISDPLKWLKAVGVLKDDMWEWPFAPWVRQTIFVALALIWLFVWFHRARVRYETHQPLKADMPLHEAAQYIAQKSAWAASLSSGDDENWTQSVARELLSALAQGRISAWGRCRESGKPTRLATAPIAAEKLQVLEFDSWKLATSDPVMWAFSGDMSYTRVLLNKEQVLRQWPQRTLFQRILGRSPIDRISKGMPEGGYRKLFREQSRKYKENPWATNAIEELFGCER